MMRLSQCSVASMFEEESEMRNEGSAVALSRVRNARLSTVILFFCCHKCHTWCEIGEKAGRKKGKNEGVESMFFSLVC